MLEVLAKRTMALAAIDGDEDAQAEEEEKMRRRKMISLSLVNLHDDKLAAHTVQLLRHGIKASKIL